jgi:hypothetical protein
MQTEALPTPRSPPKSHCQEPEGRIDAVEYRRQFETVVYYAVDAEGINISTIALIAR